MYLFSFTQIQMFSVYHVGDIVSYSCRENPKHSWICWAVCYLGNFLFFVSTMYKVETFLKAVAKSYYQLNRNSPGQNCQVSHMQKKWLYKLFRNILAYFIQVILVHISLLNYISDLCEGISIAILNYLY